MKIMTAKTQNGNLLVWEVDLRTNRPTGKAIYTTPEGDLMERKRGAQKEVSWAKSNWQSFEEVEVFGPLKEKLEKLFGDEPNMRSFGSGIKPESPFAILAKLKSE